MRLSWVALVSAFVSGAVVGIGALLTFLWSEQRAKHSDGSIWELTFAAAGGGCSDVPKGYFRLKWTIVVLSQHDGAGSPNGVKGIAGDEQSVHADLWFEAMMVNVKGTLNALTGSGTWSSGQCSGTWIGRSDWRS